MITRTLRLFFHCAFALLLGGQAHAALNWTQPSTLTGGSSWFTSYANGTWVTFGTDDGTGHYSTDLNTWTSFSPGIGSSGTIHAMAYGNSKYVLIGGDYSAPTATIMASSSIASGWSAVLTLNASPFYCVGEDGSGNFLAGLGTNSGLYYSSGGSTWSSVYSDSSSSKVNGVAFGGGRWVAAMGTGGDDFVLLTTTTPASTSSWTQITVSGSAGSIKPILYAIAYGNGMFVAAGYDADGGCVLTSTNGTDWTKHTVSSSTDLYGVAYGNGYFVAVGESGTVLSSTNGTTWSTESTGSTGHIWWIAYGDSRFTFVDSDGKCYTTAAIPTVTAISPNAGPLAGGTSVTITGTNLTGATAVKFGSTSATSYVVNSATAITATSPAGSGTVDITVTTAGGTSATSSADQFMYYSTVPDAPTIGTATAGNAQATVTFTAPTYTGGAAITGYTVTASPGSHTATGSASPLTVTGLTNGTAYTFTVTATNSVGTSPASSASNSVTPGVNPAVTGVSSTTANGSYKVGATIALTVTFDQAVTVDATGGVPTLTLETGSADRAASYVSGSGTSTLSFSYTVQSGDTSADLDYVSTSSLVLNGATIRNASSLDAILTLPTPGATGSLAANKALLVDTTAPVVTSIARLLPGPVTTASTVTWRVTFSESVTGVDISDFALTAVDGSATGTISGVAAGSTAAEYIVTATDLSGIGTLRLDVNASGTGIVDGAGNAFSGGFTQGQSYTHTRGSVPVAWGSNGNGQLGNNSTTASSVPVAVLGTGALAGKTVVAVAAGYDHSLALCSDGTVAAWGYNYYGQLGDNSTTASSVPVAVNTASALSGKTVVAVAAGGYHSLALCSDGTVAAWGRGVSGELGNNSTTNSSVPVAVSTTGGTSALYGKTVVAVAAAGHSLALCSDGTVAAWGSNGFGQLGDNSTTNRPVPVAVNTTSGTSALYGKTVVAVAAGNTHSLALCSDGTVAAWGWNYYGQLGNNSTTASSVPVAVTTASGALSGKTVVAVVAGEYHSLALCRDGTVVAWGSNFYGQLGNNSTTASSVPVAVNTASGTSALSGQRVLCLGSGSMAYHVLALASPATITAVATPAAGGYKAGDALTFTLTSSAAATVSTTSGTPRLALDVGGVTCYASYASGSGTTALTFTYTVAADDTDADGIAVTSTAIDLNGGTITDAAGWSIDPTLPTYTLPTILIDTTAPTAPITPTTTATTTNNTTPTISGTAEAGSTVTIYDDASLVATVTADGSGNWSYTFTTALASGTHTINVTSTDAAGNASTVSSSLSVTIDTTAPAAPTIATASGYTTATKPTLTGTAEAGSTVTLSEGSTTLGTATADSAGTWSYTLATALSTGTHAIVATATDTAGNTSSASTACTLIVGTAPAISTQPAPLTVTAGSSVSLTVTATGTATLTYTWQRSVDNNTFAAVSTGTTSSYTLTSATVAATGYYRVVVSNSFGTVTSSSVYLSVTPNFAAAKPDGYASATTGGSAGTAVQALTAEAFKTYATSTTAYVITVVGQLSIGTVNVASNKTIQGADASAALVGNLNLNGVSNVIVRGLHLTNPGSTIVSGAYTDGGDTLTITGSSKVFVTHCTFFDCAGCDIKIVSGSDNITVSWCEFYASASTLLHRYGLQIGTTSDTQMQHVTLHHNWWTTYLDQYMPLSYYGYVHQYSNYFNATSNSACTVASDHTQLLSERNVYATQTSPLAKYTVSTSTFVAAKIRTIGNLYNNCTGSTPDAGTDTVFAPSYSYEMLPTSDVATEISAAAGNTAGAGYTDATTGTATISGPSAAVTPYTALNLTAVPSGFTAATYQWRLDNAEISGATGSTYTVAKTQAANAGTYTVAITMASGDTVVSTPLAVTLGEEVFFQPQVDASVNGGGAPSLWYLGALLALALRRLRQRCLRQRR